MQLPSKITIGYKTYTLKLVDSDGTGLFGRTNSTTGVIEIVKGLPKDETLNTLLHEIMHGIFFVYNILRRDAQSFPSKDAAEEDIVISTTNGLMDVIIKNPELLALFKGLK